LSSACIIDLLSIEHVCSWFIAVLFVAPLLNNKAVTKQEEHVPKRSQNVTGRWNHNMSSNKDSQEIESWGGFGYALRKENRILFEEMLSNCKVGFI
jgi:hypothetical protein